MMRLGLGITRARGGDRIAALFAVPGRTGWRYPLTLDTLFQDAAGTTPVTAPGDPVGRVLDTSGNGNHRTQSTALNRPTYQVDSNGKPYLSYNGSNSSMATASFAWGSDKATVCVGVRKLSDAASAAFLEFSPSIPANAGAFAWFAPGTSATANYLWRSRGSASQVDVSYTNAAVAAPITNVLTGIGDIAGDSAILRVNGTQVASSATDQGTGDYGTYQLFWGARAGTALFFSGREYPSIGINAALNASELASVEAWVTARTGALG